MPDAAFEIRATPTFRDLQGRFARAHAGLLADRLPLVRELGRRFVMLAQEEAPGGPGRTVARQIGFRTFNDGDAVGFRTALGPIAKYHVYGTGIYGPRGVVIRPRRARALHFTVGGREVFARFVRGVRPSPMLGVAYRRWLPGARESLRRIALRYVRTFKGESQGGAL
ncbi:MAG: hypothetical protein IT318_23790 [Anaerolineales bacterium]|nr:hypothetical protein [Anaerolineales bacterium]